MNNSNRTLGDEGKLASTSSDHVDAGTTKMVVAGEVAMRPSDVYLEPEIAGALHPNDTKSVADYLEKPIPVSSGTWSSGSIAGTHLLSTTSVALLTSQILWMNKLKGFQGFRATLNLRVVLNATPFHQGRLKLSYIPGGEMNPQKLDMHGEHRIPISQLPGVEVNASQASVELKIPFVSPQRFIELNSTLFGWGNILLTVMSPLEVGASGASAISWSLWMWMTDVELFGQTNKWPESEASSMKTKVKFQSRKVRRPPSEVEKKPISSILSQGAALAGTLAQIPVLSNYAGPAAWALNAASGVAASLGWSKPVEDNSLQRVCVGYHYNMANCTGIDNSFPVALFGDNKLSVLLDPTPSGEDEMSYDFIKTRWSFVYDIQWSTSLVPGVQIHTWLLEPLKFREILSADDIFMTPVTYLANLHMLYRGGFDVCVKFSKTAFHSGSLAVSYAPGPSDVSVTLTDTSYLHRTIIDLQEGDEFCLRIPYTLPLDYLPTDLPPGRLYFHVVNPLRAPETVASNITMQVYIRGAPDLEFQVPRNPAYVPIKAQYGEVIEAQGGEVEAEGDIICSTIGEIPETSHGTLLAEQCVGEMPRSILSLLKRYVPLYTAEAATGQIAINPTILTAYGNTGTELVRPSLRTNFHSYVLSPFAFMRGGFRYRLTSDSGDTAVNHALYCAYETRPQGTITWASLRNDPSYIPVPNYVNIGSVSLVHQQSRNGGMSIQAPYAGIYRMVTVDFTAAPFDELPPFGASRGMIALPLPQGVGKNYYFLRAVADDFQALFFIGVPRMTSSL